MKRSESCVGTHEETKKSIKTGDRIFAEVRHETENAAMHINMGNLFMIQKIKGHSNTSEKTYK